MTVRPYRNISSTQAPFVDTQSSVFCCSNEQQQAAPKTSPKLAENSPPPVGRHGATSRSTITRCYGNGDNCLQQPRYIFARVRHRRHNYLLLPYCTRFTLHSTVNGVMQTDRRAVKRTSLCHHLASVRCSQVQAEDQLHSSARRWHAERWWGPIHRW